MQERALQRRLAVLDQVQPQQRLARAAGQPPGQDLQAEVRVRAAVPIQGQVARAADLGEAVDEVRLIVLVKLQLQCAAAADPPDLRAAIREQAADQGAGLGGVAAGADRLGEPRVSGGDHQGMVQIDEEGAARGRVQDLDDPTGPTQPLPPVGEAVPGQIGGTRVGAQQLQAHGVAGGVVGGAAAGGEVAVLELELGVKEGAGEQARVLRDARRGQVPQGGRMGRAGRRPLGADVEPLAGAVQVQGDGRRAGAGGPGGCGSVGLLRLAEGPSRLVPLRPGAGDSPFQWVETRGVVEPLAQVHPGAVLEEERELR